MKVRINPEETFGALHADIVSLKTVVLKNNDLSKRLELRSKNIYYHYRDLEAANLVLNEHKEFKEFVINAHRKCTKIIEDIIRIEIQEPLPISDYEIEERLTKIADRLFKIEDSFPLPFDTFYYKHAEIK